MAQICWDRECPLTGNTPGEMKQNKIKCLEEKRKEICTCCGKYDDPLCEAVVIGQYIYKPCTNEKISFAEYEKQITEATGVKPLPTTEEEKTPTPPPVKEEEETPPTPPLPIVDENEKVTNPVQLCLRRHSRMVDGVNVIDSEGFSNCVCQQGCFRVSEEKKKGETCVKACDALNRSCYQKVCQSKPLKECIADTALYDQLKQCCQQNKTTCVFPQDLQDDSYDIVAPSKEKCIQRFCPDPTQLDLCMENPENKKKIIDCFLDNNLVQASDLSLTNYPSLLPENTPFTYNDLKAFVCKDKSDCLNLSNGEAGLQINNPNRKLLCHYCNMYNIPCIDESTGQPIRICNPQDCKNQCKHLLLSNCVQDPVEQDKICKCLVLNNLQSEGCATYNTLTCNICSPEPEEMGEGPEEMGEGFRLRKRKEWLWSILLGIFLAVLVYLVWRFLKR